jgi:hypothetical protein
MPKPSTGWMLRLTLVLITVLLAFNSVGIMAQEATPEVTDTPTDVPTEAPTESPTAIPTEVPTEIPPVEPTAVPPVEMTVEPTEPIDSPVEVPAEPTEPPVEITIEPTVDVPPTEVTLSPEPELSLLVRDLFDTAEATSWLISPNWSFVPSEAGQAFQATNLDAATLLKGQFFNVAVQARFLFSSGAAQISVRQSEAGNYTASLNADGSVVLLRGGLPLGAALLPPAPAGAWRTLRISAINNVVRVAVDNVEVIAVSDSATLPPGDVTLSQVFSPVDANGAPVTNSLLADDFFLWVPTSEYSLYPAPTPVPTQSPVETPPPTEPPVATVEPTVEPTQEATPEPTAAPTDEVLPIPPDAADKDLTPVEPPSPERLIGINATGNDDFAARFNVPAGTPFVPYVDAGDSAANDAGREVGEPPSNCGYNISYTFWYTFTPATTATYSISTAGSGFDTIIQVYTGNALGALTPVTNGCNDDVSAALVTSRVQLSLTAGTAYQIQVGGFSGAYGLFNFRIQQEGVLNPPVPVLASPANAASTVDSSVTLNWTGAGTSYTFEVQVDTTNTFVLPHSFSTIVNAPTLTTTTTDLAPGLYYWRVRSLNINGVASAFSAVRTFTVKNNIMSLPADNFVTADTTPTFSWTAVTGAAGTLRYRLQVDDNNDFSSLLLDQTGLTTLNFTPAAAILGGPGYGTLYWRVLASTDSGTTYLPPTSPAPPFRKLTISPTAPVPPVQTAPAASTTTVDQTPTFTWNNSTSTLGTPYTYRFQLCTNATCTTAPIIDQTATSPFTPASNIAPGTYYWRVQTINTYGVGGAFSAGRMIKITINIMSLPDDNAVTPDTTPTFSWTAVTGVAGTLRYRLQVDDNNDFSSLLLDQTGLTTLNFTPAAAILGGPGYGTLYWRVLASTDSGTTYLPPTSPAPPFRKLTISPTAPVPPVLTAPAASATTVDQTPTFTWNNSTSTLGTPYTYRFQLCTNATCTTAPIIDQTATSPFTPASNIAPGTYYWRVQTVNQYGVGGAFSAGRMITIRTVGPTLSAPADGATLTTVRPTFTYVAYPGSTFYEIQIDDDAGFGSVNFTFNPTTASFLSTTSLPQGTWFWRVRARDAFNNFSDYSVVRSFTINLLKTPTAGQVFVTATTSANVVFSWFTATGATAYQVEVDDNTAFSSPLTCAPTLVTGLTCTINGIPLGQHYWRLKVNTGSGLQPATPPYRNFFVSPTLPLAPVLLLPANASYTNDATPTFTWNASTSTAGTPFTYELQLARNTTFTLSAVICSGLTGTSYTWGDPACSPTALTTNGLYYWRMRTVNTHGAPGNWSAYRAFTFDNVIPAVPNLALPADNATVTNGLPTFTWTLPASPPGTPRYEIRLGTTNPPTQIFNAPTASFKPTSPLLVTTYYWQVRAIDQAGNIGDWSVIRTVKIASPTNGVPILNRYTTTTPTLTWAPISWTTGGGYYQVEIYRSTSFVPANLAQASGNIANPATSYTLNPGLANGTYYWRVRACTPTATCGAWSTTGTFVIEA